MTSIPYRVIRSDRKTVALEITREGDVLVRAPRRMADKQIVRFVTEHEVWLQKHLAERAAKPSLPPFTEQELSELTKRAAEHIPSRVSYYAPLVGVSYGRVTVRKQRTRFGSCSQKGNLTFNCVLMLAPSEVLDYVIVHELCHRKELNHSARFWAEVARVMPSYKMYERWLKTEGSALVRRL